jgi:transcriptional regulator with XRE-family HTH domain/tetratricopeptide (TPR) repeat protein
MERAQLSAAREEKQWTLEEAAELVGVHPTIYSQWEKGLTFPRSYARRQLCKMYGKSAEELGLIRDRKDSHKAQQRVPVVQVQEQAPSPLSDAPDVVGRSYAAFLATDISLRCQHIMQNWPVVHSARYHDLQAVITQEIEDDNSMQDPMSRRDALRRIAALQIEFCGLSALMPVLQHPIEEILAHCAVGITACWYMRKGKDLTLASEMISAYIPTLQEIVRTASGEQQRQVAADLAAQSLLLKALLTHHVDGSNAVEKAAAYAQQAETYGEFAGSHLITVLALRSQAAIYYYGDCHEQSLHAAQKAKYFLETSRDPSIPPLVHSAVYASLARSQGYQGKKQDALTSLSKAHTTFFAQPSNERVPIWVDHDKENLILWDGMTHYHLDMHKEALDSFSQVQKIEQDTLTRRYEIMLNEVLAEVSRSDKPHNMEFCIDRWTQGIEGAKTLQSNQRYSEAIQAYTAMRVIWPTEKRVKELRDLIVHW